MKVVNKVELKIEGMDKCFLSCDSDTSLGSLYDFSCALQSFLIQKIKDAEEASKENKEKVGE